MLYSWGFFFLNLSGINSKNATQCGCRCDKNLLLALFLRTELLSLWLQEKYFSFSFCSWRKNRMSGLFISCLVTQNKGRITIALCEAPMNTSRCWIAVQSLGARPQRAAVASRSLAVALQSETTILRHRWWPSLCLSFPRTAKTDDELKRLCGWGEGGGKKRLSFIIQMKWGPADGGRRAEGLRQKPSCSLPPPFQSARDEIKSSKGISDRDGSH